MQNTETTSINEEQTRLEKRKLAIQSKDNPYKNNFDKQSDILSIINKYSDLETGESNETVIKVAGRIMAKRGHGKATFGNIKDDSGTLQYYANINTIGENSFSELLKYDVGDFIGISGTMFKSKRGELTINISSVHLLTKSLSPLPEKFHGLQDKETRYRQRYVDLIVNDDVKTTFKTRSQTVHEIRNYLNSLDFTEVETPILHKIYGGAAARPFSTYHNELKQNLYLRIAPELYLKRLMVGGFEKILKLEEFLEMKAYHLNIILSTHC